MKKLLRNILYDTDKATIIAVYDSRNDDPYGKSNFYTETMCLNSNGQYFLYYRGNGSTAGRDSVRIETEDQVVAWLEKISGEDVEKALIKMGWIKKGSEEKGYHYESTQPEKPTPNCYCSCHLQDNHPHDPRKVWLE